MKWNIKNFAKKVNELAKKASAKATCKDKGDFYVAYAGDITISAKPSSDKIVVCWGQYSDMTPGMYAGKHKATFNYKEAAHG